jgi:hypothetical protein
MAFGQDAVEQLSRELLGGYNLNTRLLALLGGGPLDGRRQEAAVAMIQELSGVFRNLMVSLFMLNSPPEAKITPAKYKRIRYASIIQIFPWGG